MSKGINILVKHGAPPWNRRGSIGVESAIIVPLFLVGILTLGFLIRITAIQESVHHSLADEAWRIAAEGSLPVHALTLPADVVKRLNEENGDRIGDVKVSPFRYRVPWMGNGRLYSDLIGVTVSYKVKPKLPTILQGDVKSGDTALTRAFVGAIQPEDPLGFSEMEKDDDGTIVWVFPKAGEKYHGENCSYIKNDPKEMLLTAEIKRKYKPCDICKPGGLGVGCLIYCFPAAGSAYHVGSCYIVDRYVISMDEQDAKEKGYNPCKKCGGR